MEKSKCRKIRPWIGPYVDGELPPSRSARVAEHVRDCPSCRSERDRIRQTGVLIRQVVKASAAAEEDFESLGRRVRERIGLSERPRREPAFRPGLQGVRFWGTRILVPSAVTMLLVAALIFVIYKAPAPVVEGVYPNECIVDSLESRAGTVMLFQTHGSGMTVIWISENGEDGREAAGLWSRRPWA